LTDFLSSLFPPTISRQKEISRLTMTGDQGTLDSSLGGGYINKASSVGPTALKVVELVS
jgi:hypothetical protein